MSKLDSKSKMRVLVRRMPSDEPTSRFDELIRKFFISICTGFVTAMLAMILTNQMNWLFIVPMSVAVLLLFGASQR
jgi:hypothetical protein